MMPEQIVGHEDVVADRGHVLAHGFDRSFPYCTRVQLPDGTEGTPERTPSRGFDEPGRAMRKAGVLTPPGIDMMAGRQRDRIENEGAGVAVRARALAVRVD